MTQNQNTSPEQTQGHTRVINTLLGPAEKKALLWLAARMPAWVTPDILTMIGLVASMIIFLGYALTFYHPAFLWLSSFGFVIQWFGDSLDGTLARYRKIERPRYGFFVDHMIDSISTALVFIGLGISPYVRFDLAMLALTSYLLLAIYVYLITYVNGIFRISYGHLGPTEVRMIGIIANTVVFFTSNITFQVPAGIFANPIALTFYDLVAIIVLVLLTSFVLINSIQSASSLSREDRIAHRAKVLAERTARRAKLQNLRDERAMRRQAARAAKISRGKQDQIQLPATGPDKT